MTDNELKALITLAADDDPEVSGHAKGVLKNYGTDSLPNLETIWESLNTVDEQSVLENIIYEIQYDELFKEFSYWVAQPQNLTKGLNLVAKTAYPNLNDTQIHQQLEQLYYECWVDFKPELHPTDQIQVLNGSFFHKLGFRGNKKNFYAPENNFISDVLTNKKGNPISLSVLYMLIGRKLGIPLFGVNLPNLFVLLYKNAHFEFYINVFNHGTIFERSDIDQYLLQLQVSAEPKYYEACTNDEIVLRMLRNLSFSYRKLENSAKHGEIKSLLGYIKEQLGK
jgi:regulator of sirC expression with transglutaminase-like and TPR domain